MGPNGELPPLVPEVEFGDDPSDRLTIAAASRGLRWLKQYRPLVFMDMMANGVFGIPATTKNPSASKKRGA